VTGRSARHRGIVGGGRRPRLLDTINGVANF